MDIKGICTPKALLRMNNGALVLIDTPDENHEAFIHYMGNLMDGDYTIPLDDYDEHLNDLANNGAVLRVYAPLPNGQPDFTTEGRKIIWERDCYSESNKFYNACHGAIREYGVRNQLIKTAEELSELTQALSKVLIVTSKLTSGEHFSCTDEELLMNLYEEVADVEIMLQQLHMIFGCDKEVDNWKRRKIDRLIERLLG